jgi:hypothetical protein
MTGIQFPSVGKIVEFFLPWSEHVGPMGRKEIHTELQNVGVESSGLWEVTGNEVGRQH